MLLLVEAGKSELRVAVSIEAVARNCLAGTFDGWGNGEWEWYRPENSFLQNGNLVIRADYASSAPVISVDLVVTRLSKLST